MNKNAHIIRWLGVAAITLLMVDCARAQNIPELLQRHDGEIKQLQKKLSDIETRLNSLLEKTAEGSIPSSSEQSECVTIPENEKSRRLGLNETWVVLSGKLKLRYFKFGLDLKTGKYYGSFKSNITELSRAKILGKEFIEFKINSCQYSLQILGFDPKMKTVIISLLDF